MNKLKRQNQFIAGILICAVGAICFSTKAIFVKLAYRETAVDPVSLLTLRMLFSVPFFIASAFIFSNRHDNVRFSGKQWTAVAITGALGYYVSSLLDFVGLQYISAGIERLILFIYPTLVLLMSAIFFKEKIKRNQWLAVGITYIGLVIAFAGEMRSDTKGHFYLGSILIFACAFTYAAFIVGSGKLIPVIGAAKFNGYAMTFASLAVVVHFFVVSDQSLLHLPTKVYGYSFFMAILATVIPSFLVAEGIRRIGSENTAIVSSIGPISTLVQARILLFEPISALQILGTLFILAGIFLIGWKQKARAV